MSRRDYKEFGEGEWYHVFSRGNSKYDIFREPQDYAAFKHRLHTVLNSRGALEVAQGRPLSGSAHMNGKNPVRIAPFDAGTFSIAVYCLMPNHFHFLIRQNTEVSISKLFLKLLTSYSMYFNRKYDHVGHVFQDRIKAVRITDNEQLLHVSAYIHQNPKVARLVRDVRTWPHSSYPEYLAESDGGVCDKTILLEQFRSPREYLRLVEDAFDDIRARKDIRELMMDEI